MIILLLGCVDPFPTDRHDLLDLRIVGLRADESGALASYLWEGTEGWSAEAPSATWGGDAVCAASSCSMDGPGTATIEVTGAVSGTEAGRLVVSEGANPPVLAGVMQSPIEGGVSVALDVPGAATVHFMSPVGEFTETAFGATEFTVDEDGVWPVVALWLDGKGGNGWVSIDVDVGGTGPWLAVGERLLSVDTELPEGPVTVLATITATETIAGFTLSDVVVDDGSAVDTVCGADADGWDPDSLIERRCGRDEVEGARVRIVGEGRP